MKEHQSISEKEARQKAKREAEESQRIVREIERKKVYLAKEQMIQQASDSRKADRAEKRATETTEQLAAGQARKKAYSDKEKTVAEAHQARHLREKK